MKNSILNRITNSSVAESTESKEMGADMGTIAQEIAAQEAVLNVVLALLKSKNLSKEEHEKLWEDAYEKAVSLLDYKVKMGKLIAETKRASGLRTDLVPYGNKVSKKSVYKALGLSPKQAANYQLMARNPDAVEKAKNEAIEKQDIPSVYQVLKIIRESWKPSDKPESDNTPPCIEDNPETPTEPVSDNASSCNKDNPGTSNNSVSANGANSPKEKTFDRRITCIDFPEKCDTKEFIKRFRDKADIYFYVQVTPAQAEKYLNSQSAKGIKNIFGIGVK